MQTLRSRLDGIVGGPDRVPTIAVLALVLGLQSADVGAVGAVALPLEQNFHISHTQIGLLVTISTITGALFTIPAGLLVDRLHRVRLLVWAIIVWAAGLVLSSLSTSYVMLLWTRMLLGVVVAVAGPAVASLTGDLFPAEERSRIFGFILAGEIVGAGAGLLIAGTITAVFSWRVAFALLAAATLGLAAVVRHVLVEPTRTTPRQRPRRARSQPRRNVVHETLQALRYIVTVPTNIVLVISSALGYFFFSGLRTFAVVFLRARFSLGQAGASTLAVLIGTGALIGVVGAGRAADRLAGSGHAAARPVFAGAAFLVAAALFLPAVSITTAVIAVPLMFAAAIAYASSNPALDAARLDIMPRRIWGRAEGARTMLRSVVEALAPLTVGFLATVFGAPGAPAPTESTTGSAVVPASPLASAFLVLLGPLAIGGLLLLVVARRTYPRDVRRAESVDRDDAPLP